MPTYEYATEEGIEKSGEDIAREMLALADRLEAGGLEHSLDDTLFRMAVTQAVTFLRIAAPAMVTDRCRMDVPHARLYRFRDVDGKNRWTCDHNPPHITDG